MDSINLQLVLIGIVLAVIGALVMRFIIQKNKRAELHQLTSKKFEELTKLKEDSEEALTRTEQISKNDESITLFNKWYKEFKDIEQDMTDLNTDYLDVVAAFNRGNHNDFIELDKSMNYKLDAMNERLTSLHSRLFNFTSYELENTKIALELKTQLKEIQNNFEINLMVKEVYTESFEHVCSKVDAELTRFEDLQKNGNYPKARKHLKNATDFINSLDCNYEVITNMLNSLEGVNANVLIIDEICEQIAELNFRLDQDEYLQNFEQLRNDKDQLEVVANELKFGPQISDEFITTNTNQINEINANIEHILVSINEQYQKIKVIKTTIEDNEKLFEQSERLIEGAIEERDAINELYEMPENKDIQKLEVEINRFENFKNDYQVLLDIVFDLKEDYNTLVERISQSNEYLKHFIVNLKEAIDGLREIRIDEVHALESINLYKQQITQIEFYLNRYNHLTHMSHGLQIKYNDAYQKIAELNELLKETPINISKVRILTTASETLLAELKPAAEEEIKTRNEAMELIRFANRFVEDEASKNLIDYNLTLFNNKQYTTVVKEIRQYIHNDFESADELYKQLIEAVEAPTIEYVGGE